MSILVVDDDPTVREVLVDYLRAAGFEVRSCGDGAQALAMVTDQHPDLVLLDLSLPGMDGLEVFRRLRQTDGSLPVVMVTARSEEPDRILGFEVGADDYVAKPFSPREVVLRVQSVIRRANTATGRDQLVPLADGDLRLDVAARSATRAGQPLPLTTREYDLLAFLVQHPGQVYSREELMREVWGWEFGDQTTVTVHVRRVREKVESDPATPSRLVTVWGAGYRWDRLDPIGEP